MMEAFISLTWLLVAIAAFDIHLPAVLFTVPQGLWTAVADRML